MSASIEVPLWVIAIATSLLVLIQVGGIVVLVMLVKRVTGIVDRVERDLKPTIERINAISHEASKAASLATMQIERLDGAMSRVSGSVEQSIAALQRSLSAPARQGAALLSAVRATVGALRDVRDGRRQRDDGSDRDDDYLFI